MAQIPYPTGKKPVIKPVFPPLDAGRSMSAKQPAAVAPKVAPKVNMVRPSGPAPAAFAASSANPSMGRAMTVASPAASKLAQNLRINPSNPSAASSIRVDTSYQPTDFDKFSNFTGLTPEMFDRNNMSFIRTLFDPNKFPIVSPLGKRQTTIAGTPFRTKGVLGGGLPRPMTNAERTQDAMNIALQAKGPLIGAGFLAADRLTQGLGQSNNRFSPKNVYAPLVTASKVIPYGTKMYKDLRSGNLMGAGQNGVNILENLAQTPTVNYLKDQTGTDYRGLLAWISKLRRMGQ